MRFMISRTLRVMVGSPARVFVGLDGEKVVTVQVGVTGLDASSLRLTAEESENSTGSWTPVGGSETIDEVGTLVLTRSGITDRYARALFEALGDEGESVDVSAALTVEVPDGAGAD